MIKAVILDIDGVVLGGREGVNTPMPSKAVSEKLIQLNNSGIKVIGCTGRPGFALSPIAEKLELNNAHVSDGGALVFNPLSDEIHDIHGIDKKELKKMVKVLLKNNIYVELYTPENYNILKKQECYLTKKHFQILTIEPKRQESFDKIIEKEQAIKIIALAKDENQKQEIIEIHKEQNTDLVLSWGVHLSSNPAQYGILTEKGISKESGVRKALELEGVDFAHALGVGDSTSDWQFMEYCKYKATLENGSQDIKDLVEKSGGYMGPNVDNDGLIDIFDYFKL